MVTDGCRVPKFAKDDRAVRRACTPKTHHTSPHQHFRGFKLSFLFKRSLLLPISVMPAVARRLCVLALRRAGWARFVRSAQIRYNGAQSASAQAPGDISAQPTPCAAAAGPAACLVVDAGAARDDREPRLCGAVRRHEPSEALGRSRRARDRPRDPRDVSLASRGGGIERIVAESSGKRRRRSCQ